MRRLLLLFFVLSTAQLLAQDKLSVFKHLNTDDGLSSNQISTILQDNDGYIWAGTLDGLARYDGYGFTMLKKKPSDSLSLVNNSIRSMAKDSKGNLWIGTQNGLAYLDLDTYRFKRFTTRFNENIGSAWINSLAFLNPTKLLVATFTHGLNVFDIEKNKVEIFSHKDADPGSLINNTVRFLLKDRQGMVWLATDGGLDRFDPSKKTFTHFFAGQGFIHLCLDPDGFLIASPIDEQEILKMDPKTGKQVDKIVLLPNYQNKSKTVFFDGVGNTWIGIIDYGILFTSKKTGETIRLKFDKYHPEGINSNTPLTFFEDRDGNVWIGTFEGGMNVYLKNRKPFQLVKSNFLDNGLQSNHVRTLFQDEEGDIWVGTKIGGMLSKFNPVTKEFVHYKNTPGQSGCLNDEFVLSITDSKKGFLTVGTLYGGINIFNKKTGTFSLLQPNAKGQGISSKAILCLRQDKDGLLWVGNGEKGLDVYDPSQNTFQHFGSTSDPNSLSDNRVRVILQTSQHEIWIGTFNGLNLYDPVKKNFRKFFNSISDKNSISDNNILSIFEDRKHDLWIGTSNGFNKLDRKTMKFICYTNDNGFMANNAKGICDDANGNIWISSESGIVKFNPQEQKFKLFTKEDGLISNEFTSYSSLLTREGMIYYGSENGFVFFDPLKITDNMNIPPVVITSFKIFNREVVFGETDSPLNKHISHTKEISLNHKQSVLTFGFAALNFTSTEKNQYAYMMEGFDKEWNYVGTQRYATYTNLPPGKYTLRVKASNNDGIWNLSGASIIVNVQPAWWQTWWFKISVFLFISVCAISFYTYRVRSLKAQKLKLETMVKHRTADLQEANVLLEERQEEILLQTEELQIQKDIVTAKNENIKASIRYAQTIQQAMLPNESDMNHLMDSFVLYQPKDIVSGDFYWNTVLEPNEQFSRRMMLAVVDCTGHGVPGAFMSLIGNRIINEIVIEEHVEDPKLVLEKMDIKIKKSLNQEHSSNTDGMDMVICLLEYSETVSVLTYSGAKGSFFYYDSQQKHVSKIKGNSRSIGGARVSRNRESFSNASFEFRKGDWIYLTTDGFVDQNNEARKSYGSQRLMALLEGIAHLPATEQKASLSASLCEWQSNEPQRDDITLWGVQL